MFSMEAMRRRMKVVLWAVVISFVATVFWVWGAGGKLGGDQGIAARVNGEAITSIEYTRAWRGVQEQMKPGMNIEEQQKRVLFDLVNRRLLLQAAKKYGVGVSPDELAHRGRTMINAKDDFQLRNLLQSPQVPESQWLLVEEEARRQLLLEKLQVMIASGARASEAEIKDAYLRDQEERDLAWMAIDMKPTPQEEQDALNKAKTTLARLKAGEEFAKVAREVSDDHGTKDKGGDVGILVKGRGLIKEFEDAAFALKEKELSEPVKTKYGYHILRVDEKKEKTKDQEASVHVRHIMVLLRPSQQTLQQLYGQIDGLATRLREGAPFEQVAGAAHRKGVVTSVTRAKKILDKVSDSAEPIVQSAFGLKVGESSPQPIMAGEAWYLAKVLISRTGKMDGFELSRDDYHKKVLERKSQELFNLWFADLHKRSKINILAFK